MGDIANQASMQVTPAVWQKIVVSVIAALIGGCALWMAGSILWPATIVSADHWEQYTPGGRAFALMVAVALFGATFYYWRVGMQLRLRADSRGVTQTNGFKTIFVPWVAIASYTVEDVGNYREHMYEPVLRGHDGQILLRPILPLIVSSAGVREARAQFWNGVLSKIDTAGARSQDNS